MTRHYSGAGALTPEQVASFQALYDKTSNDDDWAAMARTEGISMAQLAQNMIDGGQPGDAADINNAIVRTVIRATAPYQAWLAAGRPQAGATSGTSGTSTGTTSGTSGSSRTTGGSRSSPTGSSSQTPGNLPAIPTQPNAPAAGFPWRTVATVAGIGILGGAAVGAVIHFSGKKKRR